jgi:hypothetical protein
MKFLLITLIALCSTVFAEDYLSEDKVETDDRNFVVCTKADHKPVTGDVVSYFDDGSTKSIIHYKNGKEHGCRRRFYRNGRVMLEQEMQNGAYGAKGVGWHDNGRQYFEVLRDKPYSIVKTTFWDRDGNAFTDKYLGFSGDWPYRHISDEIKVPPKDYSILKTGRCSNSSGRTMEEAVTVLAWNGPSGRRAEKEWIATKYPDSQIIEVRNIETFDVVYTWYSVRRPGVFLPLTIYFDSTDHYGIF